MGSGHPQQTGDGGLIFDGAVVLRLDPNMWIPNQSQGVTKGCRRNEGKGEKG